MLVILLPLETVEFVSFSSSVKEGLTPLDVDKAEQELDILP